MKQTKQGILSTSAKLALMAAVLLGLTGCFATSHDNHDRKHGNGHSGHDHSDHHGHDHKSDRH